MKVEGGCHCGQIAYEAEVDLEAAGMCHCTDCQTLTGSAFRITLPAPAAGFRLLRGQPTIYVKTADSGTKRRHAFCPNCGAPIYATALEDGASYSLRVGALKQRALIGRPKRQIFCQSALPWLTEIDDIERRERG